MKDFPNYAGRDDVDAELSKELEDAGINAVCINILRKSSGEVVTGVMGELEPSGWGFRRAWYYWVASGPGIPPNFADKLHEEFGQEVRVDGHCGCPSPKEWCNGFGVGMYHVDSRRGLKALADVIKQIMTESAAKV